MPGIAACATSRLCLKTLDQQRSRRDTQIDPAAQWTGAHKGPAFFAYSDNYLIDVKFGVIVDVEASRSIRQAEVGAAKTMIERTEERFGLKPDSLSGIPLTGQLRC
jgi:hypothetical protein